MQKAITRTMENNTKKANDSIMKKRMNRLDEKEEDMMKKIV